jgi:hypothetical protein
MISNDKKIDYLANPVQVLIAHLNLNGLLRPMTTCESFLELFTANTAKELTLKQ